MSDVLLLLWAQFGSLVKLGLVMWIGLWTLRWLDRQPWVRDVAKRFQYPELYFGLRFVGICIAAAAVAGCAPVQGATLMPAKYDRQIEKAAATYLPGVPWRLYKAQLWQESRLDPLARSPAGAEGLAQFMPATWAEQSRALGLAALARTDADASVTLGAVYMARLRRQWAVERPWRDRHSLALASYNAGLGHILGAQRACHRLQRDWPEGPAPRLYVEIMVCLPEITGPKHSRETLAYAPAIFRWWALMEGAA